MGKRWDTVSFGFAVAEYESLKDLKRYCRGADAFMRRNDLRHSSLCCHLSSRSTQWDIVSLGFAAADFATPSSLARGNVSAYSGLVKRGLRRSPLCSHLAPVEKTSDNDAVYVWRLEGYPQVRDEPIYKIGITSQRRGDARIRTVGKAVQRHLDCKVADIRIFPADDALALEKEALMIGESPGFVGFDGCTEFRYLTDTQYREVLSVFGGSWLGLHPRSAESYFSVA